MAKGEVGNAGQARPKSLRVARLIGSHDDHLRIYSGYDLAKECQMYALCVSTDAEMAN